MVPEERDALYFGEKYHRRQQQKMRECVIIKQRSARNLNDQLMI